MAGDGGLKLRQMPAPELDQVGAALGQAVLGSRRLAGGFSHETCLLTLPDRQVVARLGGQDPAIEAAVMAAAGRQVPVPEVVLVLPAAETGARPVMVIEYAQGTLLSEVLAGKPDAADSRAADLRALGAEVGRTSAGISAAAFERPGFFSDGMLSVGPGQPWSTQLAEFAATCMEAVPPARLDPASRAAWAGLCARHAGALTEIDAQARLVHADLNPKNLLVMRAGDGWQVTAVLDWEFSFSGCPYADAANMVRFAADYPPGFADGFLDGFAGHQAAGLPPPGDWLYLGRVLDMFALSDLVTRPAGHGVADQAASQIRRWLDSDVPGWPLAPRPPGAKPPGPAP